MDVFCAMQHWRLYVNQRENMIVPQQRHICLNKEGQNVYHFKNPGIPIGSTEVEEENTLQRCSVLNIHNFISDSPETFSHVCTGDHSRWFPAERVFTKPLCGPLLLDKRLRIMNAAIISSNNIKPTYIKVIFIVKPNYYRPAQIPSCDTFKQIPLCIVLPSHTQKSLTTAICQRWAK